MIDTTKENALELKIILNKIYALHKLQNKFK